MAQLPPPYVDIPITDIPVNGARVTDARVTEIVEESAGLDEPSARDE
jgi:hypothetical protein